MSFKTLLVHAEPKGASDTRMGAVAALARGLGARVVGVGAVQWDPVVEPSFTFVAAEALEAVAERLDAELKDAGTRFRRIMQSAGVEFDWRDSKIDPLGAMADLRPMADLVIASPRDDQDYRRHADPSDLVMTMGLPVLVTPRDLKQIRTNTIVIAWKNRREASRAVADALPFLQQAERVVVVGVCEDSEPDALRAELDGLVARLRLRRVGGRGPLAAARAGHRRPDHRHRRRARGRHDRVRGLRAYAAAGMGVRRRNQAVAVPEHCAGVLQPLSAAGALLNWAPPDRCRCGGLYEARRRCRRSAPVPAGNAGEPGRPSALEARRLRLAAPAAAPDHRGPRLTGV